MADPGRRSPVAPADTPETIAIARAQQGLKLVSASLPHLAGLAHAVRLQTSKRYPVAAISASGLLIINPRVFAETAMADIVFVLAHELLHLALDTFDRQGKADPRQVNIAHDYIINDILKTELGRSIPLQGLEQSGARFKSLEKILTELQNHGREKCWNLGTRTPAATRIKPGKSKISEELERLKLIPTEDPPTEEADPEQYPDGDIISAEEESKLDPRPTGERHRLRERIRHEATKAASLEELRRTMERSVGPDPGQAASDPGEAFIEAIATTYTPPWQLALQHWLDAVAPGPRTYARPSRRSGDRADLVLPGRKREGWTIHVVLDTSGSMLDTLPAVLGLLGQFCEASGVTEVHILQCDRDVTAEEWLDPAGLGSYKIVGLGGSDMSPALDRLSQDPEVSAVLVLTDGYIEYPESEPHYALLWGLVNGIEEFTPDYGSVISIRL